MATQLNFLWSQDMLPLLILGLVLILSFACVFSAVRRRGAKPGESIKTCQPTDQAVRALAVFSAVGLIIVVATGIAAYLTESILLAVCAIIGAGDLWDDVRKRADRIAFCQNKGENETALPAMPSRGGATEPVTAPPAGGLGERGPYFAKGGLPAGGEPPPVVANDTRIRHGDSESE